MPRGIAPFLAIVSFFLSASVFGQTTFLRPKEPVQSIHGALVLMGGGVIPDSIYDAFLKLAGGSKARLVIISTDNAEDVNESHILGPWNKRNAASVNLLHAMQVPNLELMKPLADATGVWLEDGAPTKLVITLRGTPLEAELGMLLRRGGVLGSTAGAPVSQFMIAGDKGPPKLIEGMDFLSGAVVEQHVLKRNNLNRLIEVLSANPGLFGLGIDDRTAVIVHGRNLSAVGESYAVACLAAGKDRPASCHVLKPGDKADLVALSRAALARMHEPHPALKPPVPMVAKGALIIGGGGALIDDVWNKFIEVAGGPTANIVCISTAMDFPLKGEPVESRILKKLGALHVKTMHAQSRAEANSPDFLKALQKANGLWFTGGRQWRFVDAYENTAAEKAFHDVLARGGVIGGSSAGASIQADYMVRGDPLGNLNIMAEGYERGFGFLKGVALDQHFLKRKRTADMTELMNRYPQLLGIGIDESAALYVHGEIMEVMGKTNVFVYDRTRPAAGEHNYEVLKPGTRFNLRTRQTQLEKQP